MNMHKMMKQVQKMQAEMARVQEELAEEEVSATVGGGVVTVIFNGHQELLSVEIEPDVVDPEDVDMLQDLVLAAVNEGLRRSKEMAEQAMGKVTGGINIPGLPGF